MCGLKKILMGALIAVLIVSGTFCPAGADDDEDCGYGGYYHRKGEHRGYGHEAYDHQGYGH